MANPKLSPDPAYQSELLQTSFFYLLTKNRDLAVECEERVFRLQNGKWSLWNTDGKGVVTEKITELTLKEPMPPSATLKSDQKDWKDGNGVGKYLGLKFYMGEEPSWTMYHKVEREGKVTLQETLYRKKPDPRQEGWIEWFAKGAEIGYKDMKARYKDMKGFIGV